MHVLRTVNVRCTFCCVELEALETISNVILKSHRPQNKTFIRGASPGVSDELWDKNDIGGRRWDVAAQERKVCNVENKIVTLVVNWTNFISV